MRWLLALGLVLVSSCIRSGLVECDDGVACPVGYTCTPNGCRSPEQLAVCTGLDDGAECRVAGAAGICDQGACVVPNCGNGLLEPGELCDDGNTTSRDGCNGTCTSGETCGNGIVELSEQCDCGDAEHPGDPSCEGTYNGGPSCSAVCEVPVCGDGVVDADEVCDDGNAVPGDGCSFDCKSAESCGNGIVDYFAGEACDDGNTRNRDGCAASCREEPLAWQSSNDDGLLGPRSGMVAAYDAARKRVVAFGGYSGSTLTNETWEHDGARWTKRELAVRPPPRGAAAMVYDSRRHRLVMFGGLSQIGRVAETWEYDGIAWSQRATLGAPPPRSNVAMSYDAVRERVVLFGGFVTPGGAAADTWEYDGTSWVQVTPTTSPAKRFGHAMAFDPVRGRTVLFGGSDGFEDKGETWEYDGTTWTLEDYEDYPEARASAMMTFDTRRGRVVMFGGVATPAGGGDEAFYLDGAYEWDGLQWQLVGFEAQPYGRAHHSFVHDIERGWNVLFGGYNDLDEDFNPDYPQDTRALTTVDWIDLLAPRPVPAAATAFAVAYDSRRGRLVLLKGTETWEHDGRSWIARAPATSPPSGSALALAYDVERGVTVMYGTNAITWEYDGTTWQQRTPATAPPARALTAMTYDAVRKRVVLFGGRTVSAVVLVDTWEYDGSDWTQRFPTTSPSARVGHRMAYDHARQRTVLFGGTNDETWEYDGATWQQVVTAVSPARRTNPALTYDSARRRIVMFGGFGPTSPLGDTWEYDGTTWAPSVLDTSPPAGFGLGMVFDTVNERTLLYAGTGTGELWQLRGIQQAAGEACTAGVDYDADGAAGCDDDECWGTCSPVCLPGAPIASCVAQPACGDGVCGAVENCRNCPADCAAGGASCPPLCGDYACDATENATSCPGDC